MMVEAMDPTSIKEENGSQIIIVFTCPLQLLRISKT
jgi:hypothetical protein